MAPKTVAIGLKIVELVSLVAATAVMTYFVNKRHEDVTKDDPKIDPLDLGQFGRHEFFLYTTTVGVIIAIVFIVNLINGSDEEKGGAVVMFAVHLLWALQLLASTAMLAKVLRAYQTETERQRQSMCDQWDETNQDYQCNQVVGGVGCGFLAFVLFCVDTVIYYRAYKQS